MCIVQCSKLEHCSLEQLTFSRLEAYHLKYVYQQIKLLPKSTLFRIESFLPTNFLCLCTDFNVVNNALCSSAQFTELNSVEPKYLDDSTFRISHN